MKTIQKVIVVAVVVFLTIGNAIRLNENSTKSCSSCSGSSSSSSSSSSSLFHNELCDPIK